MAGVRRGGSSKTLMATAHAAHRRSRPSRRPTPKPSSTWLGDLRASLGDRRLDGLKLVADAGHGAASPFVRELFEHGRCRHRRAQRRARRPQHQPGLRLHLSGRRRRPGGRAPADLGLDLRRRRRPLPDRRRHRRRDGDAILYLWARDLHRRGELPGGAIVATSMSNLGLEVALRRQGIDLVRCDVGDRHVVETLRQREPGARRRAERPHRASRPVHHRRRPADGTAGGPHRHRLGRDLPDLLADFQRFPQLLLNVPVDHKPDLDSLPRVVESRRDIERTLGPGPPGAALQRHRAQGPHHDRR